MEVSPTEYSLSPSLSREGRDAIAPMTCLQAMKNSTDPCQVTRNTPRRGFPTKCPVSPELGLLEISVSSSTQRSSNHRIFRFQGDDLGRCLPKEHPLYCMVFWVAGVLPLRRGRTQA